MYIYIYGVLYILSALLLKRSRERKHDRDYIERSHNLMRFSVDVVDNPCLDSRIKYVSCLTKCQEKSKGLNVTEI